jgi:hypothetical protein
MIRHKLFRFARHTSWETACDEVETWINSNVRADDVVSVMMEDNEEAMGKCDVVVVWYRERK